MTYKMGSTILACDGIDRPVCLHCTQCDTEVTAMLLQGKGKFPPYPE